MKDWSKDNCLFCPTDSYLYSQVLKSDAEKRLKYLQEKYPEYKWRIDEHEYAYTALPELGRYGGCMYNNPNKLMDNNVWITFAPEGSTCRVNKSNEVVVHTGVYEIYTSFVFGLHF